MTKKFIFLLLLMFTGLQIMQAQQTYSIKGIVKDAANGEPVSFANVVIWNTIEGTVTDSIGQFEITGVSPGSYRLQASFIGYKPTVTTPPLIASAGSLHVPAFCAVRVRQ